MCIVLHEIFCFGRLYTQPKDTAIFNYLTTESYKNIMKNNINMEDSFNPIKIGIQKVLNEPNTAFFAIDVDVPKNYKSLVRHIYNRRPKFIKV